MTGLTSEEISDYLRQNPEFLTQNPELIADLEADGALPPFHERQLEVLRQRHSAEQQKYRMVVDSARNNMALEKALHQFALDLLLLLSDDSGGYQLPLENLISKNFELTCCRLFFADGPDAEEQSADYSLLAPRVIHGGSICDDRVSRAQLDSIFKPGNNIASCAFVPLPDAKNPDAIIGVMVFGADDASRFQPGMGAIYLDRIGQLAGAFLQGRP